MSLNIELDVSALTARLDKVEEAQRHIITLMEHLLGSRASTTPPHVSPISGIVRKRHFVIKQPNLNGRPTQYLDVERLVIIPYLKENNPTATNKTAKELMEISDFFLKYYILKRMEQGLYSNTKHWSDIPQEIKEDAIKRLETFIRENLFFPFDKCENSWSSDFLLGAAWTKYVDIANVAAAARQRQQAEQRSSQQSGSSMDNGEKNA
jgi:hypothetical protein